MFRYLDSPNFRITHSASITGPERYGLMSWKFQAMPNRGPRKIVRIVGRSEVCLTADGQIFKHIDHWDAGRQLYERIPLIGWLLRRIRARLKV
jgi:hypothetical protein